MAIKDYVPAEISQLPRPTFGGTTRSLYSWVMGKTDAQIAENKSLEGGRSSLSNSNMFIRCYPLELPTVENLSKIRFGAKIIKSQALDGRALPTTISETPMITFEFIAPNEIIESVSHQWEAYESVASKVQEAAISMGKNFQKAKSAIEAITATEVRSSWADTMRSAQIGDVYQSRIDVPLVYKNSERRRYEFTFQLGHFKNTLDEIIMPVKTLMALSCPELPRNAEGTAPIGAVNPPCCFEISTFPVEGIINVKNAALLSVQPTYKGPFHNGLPSSCDLHLTFEEIDPLWDTQFTAISYKVLTTETGNASTAKVN